MEFSGCDWYSGTDFSAEGGEKVVIQERGKAEITKTEITVSVDIFIVVLFLLYVSWLLNSVQIAPMIKFQSLEKFMSETYSC